MQRVDAAHLFKRRFPSMHASCRTVSIFGIENRSVLCYNGFKYKI